MNDLVHTCMHRATYHNNIDLITASGTLAVTTLTSGTLKLGGTTTSVYMHWISTYHNVTTPTSGTLKLGGTTTCVYMHWISLHAFSVGADLCILHGPS